MIHYKTRNLIFLFVSIILILFSISCASATNNNTYVSVNGNESWDGSSPTHITNTNQGPKLTIASGLSVTNNGGNVSIAAGTYKENNLIISKNLTISGASKTNTTINAMAGNLIFWIKPSAIVTIKNLNLTNGTTSSDIFNRNGGGIYNEGTLTIDNCSLFNNHAKNANNAGHAGGSDASPAGNGGAIYNKGTLTLTNCEFSNNYAGNGGEATDTHKSSGGGSGGAIYNLGTILNIQACTFRNNYAGNGGKGSDFHDGGDGGDGGAIYNNGTLNISNSEIKNNSAGKGGAGPGASKAGEDGTGGGIYNIGGIIPINTQIFNNTPDNYNNLNCVINNRTKEYYNKIKDAINDASSNDTLLIQPSTYKENNLIISKNLTIIGASKNNTIIDGNNENLIFFIQTGVTVTIKNLNMTNGQATIADYNRNGGAINNKGTLIIDNCIFDNNQAKYADDADSGDDADTAGNGGAIYNTGALTIKNSEFDNNHAGKGGDSSATHKGSPGGSGGAIYNLGTITSIQACTFRKNYAGKGGAASEYHDGHSGGSGGAIYNAGTINNILSCVFIGNYAGNGGSAPLLSGAKPGKGGSGGAIYSNNSVTVNNSTFDGNYAGTGGEGAYDDGGAGGSGGAIYNTGTITIANCQLQNNYAGDGGAGYLAYSGGAGGYGGAIWNSGTFTITNCEIQNNTAGIGGTGYGNEDYNEFDGDNGWGGGIYNSATLTINNSKIHDNTAENGGGIYNTGNTNITNTPLANNTAKVRTHNYYKKLLAIYGSEGGAIWNNGILTMMNITFTNNTAIYGGAIYYTGNGTYSVTNCSFINNNATAVDNYGIPMSVTTYSIEGGWKVFVSTVIKDISKSFLIYAISPRQGIASIVTDVLDVVKLVDADTNDIEAAGGAIYMIKSVSLTVNNSVFTNNTASIGGGICNVGNGTLIIINSQFTGNAAGVGGAVYCNNLGPLNATNNIFNGNCAHGGGAIGYTGTESSQWGNLTVKENIFSHNDASLGGSVYDNFKGNTHIYMNFNRIYGTFNYDIYDEVGKADVTFNWWGTNFGPRTYHAYGLVDTSHWLILKIKSPDVSIGDNSTIEFNMLDDVNGTNPNPAYGILPDGIPISLTVSSGTITPNTVTIINGLAYATYIANGNSGPITINATVDNNDSFLVYSTFNVNKITTITSVDPINSFAGQNVTLVAKVNSGRIINEGNVIFSIGTQEVGTAPVVNGYAEYYLHIPELTQSKLYTLYAFYNGTYKYTTSQASADFLVPTPQIGSTVISVYPPVNGTQGQIVNLQARLMDAYQKLPLANKNLTFSKGNIILGSAITNSDGVASLPYRILLAPDSYTILASFAGDFPYASCSNTGMLNVNPSPTGVSDLTITRKVQSIIRLGEKFTVTVKIGNKGPDIAKNVVIRFSIPEGLDFITASVDQGTWSYDEASRLFTWNLGDVAVGDPYLDITLKANQLGEYLLRHLLTTASFDPNLENQMTPLSIVISSPENNNGSNGNESSVNVEGKTIGMQKTGLPVAGLILTILALIGGLAISKRK